MLGCWQGTFFLKVRCRRQTFHNHLQSSSSSSFCSILLTFVLQLYTLSLSIFVALLSLSFHLFVSRSPLSLTFSHSANLIGDKTPRPCKKNLAYPHIVLIRAPYNTLNKAHLSYGLVERETLRCVILRDALTSLTTLPLIMLQRPIISHNIIEAAGSELIVSGFRPLGDSKSSQGT